MNALRPGGDAPTGWLRVACRPGKADGHLVFPYELTNDGPNPVLVMDAWRRAAEDDAAPTADPQLAQVVLREDEVAVVGKYVPALADAARPMVPHLPLCAVLKPGEAMTRELRVRLPLAEQTPYVGEALLSRYEQVELRGLLFAIGWWPLAQKGLAAAEWPFAPGLHAVTPLARLPAAGTAQQHFPTTRLHILKRRDAFPRSFPAHPEL